MKNFDELLLHLKSTLKLFGFVKKGGYFILEKDTNCGIIHIQKSRENSKFETRFTINIGVQSRFLTEEVDKELFDSHNPNIDYCHWKIRLGPNPCNEEEVWWTTSGSNDQELKLAFSNAIVNQAVPKLNSMLSDDALLNLFYSGVSEGITNLQRLRYLLALMKRSEDSRISNIVEEVLNFSKNRHFEKSIVEELRYLNLYGE